MEPVTQSQDEMKRNSDRTRVATSRRAEAGAVLMETVIAIPLYMILLGGIFWIGDLAITRMRLVAADRYVAWNKGLRYDDRGKVNASDIHELFLSDKYGIKSQYHQPSVRASQIQKTYDWSHMANGQVSARVQMPDWVYGMINAMRLHTGRGTWLSDTTVVYGRERLGQRHVVLMRTPAGAQMSKIRNKYGVSASGEAADKWSDVANEKWPYE
jgi:hypothetical protein